MGSHDTFYAVLAQVVPIIFLALALELRFFEWKPHHNSLPRGNRLFVLLLPVMFVLTEGACLYPLVGGRDTELLRALCVVGVGFCAALVLLVPVKRWFGSAFRAAVSEKNDRLLRDLKQEEQIALIGIYGSAISPGFVLTFLALTST